MRPGNEAKRRRQRGALERLRVDYAVWFKMNYSYMDKEDRPSFEELQRNNLRRIPKEIETLEQRLGVPEQERFSVQ